MSEFLKFNEQIAYYMLLQRVKNNKKLHEIWFFITDKLVCFGLKNFALITTLNYFAYLQNLKMNTVLQQEENFHFKVTNNKNFTAAKLINLIKDNQLNKVQKLKCTLIWLIHSILLARDSSKMINSNQIKIMDNLDFFKNYSWREESFELTLTYLKKKINFAEATKSIMRGRIYCTLYTVFFEQFWYLLSTI